MAKNELPGIAFEKAVATIQAQIDPTSTVAHDERLTDRLGHERQFDIVIRGAFAGQPMLGVIECKDLARRVGNPEVDAFITKAQDINANFKVMISRKGFSKPALEKCAHYGVQALSLVKSDPATRQFFLGTRWTADVTRWGQVMVSLHLEDPPKSPVNFRAEDLKIGGQKVLDWFTNYLLDYKPAGGSLGWVVDIATVFDVPQMVEVRPNTAFRCVAIGFKAERVCEKLQRLVGISGTGFYNWNSKEATFPPGTTISTDAVPTDFSQWEPRSEEAMRPNGFIEIHLEAHVVGFERVENVIELDVL